MTYQDKVVDEHEPAKKSTLHKMTAHFFRDCCIIKVGGVRISFRRIEVKA